jgi:hypothetical protein
MNDKIPTITINLDAKCVECRKSGAAQSGICLSCTTRAIQGRAMKTDVGRAVAARFKESLRRPHSGR